MPCSENAERHRDRHDGEHDSGLLTELVEGEECEDH